MKQVDLSDTALVVLNYNTPKLTISAANHILSLQTGIHIVLVDNASTDGSLEIFKKEFEGNKLVSIVASKENGGYAKGNNLAFSYVYQMKGIKFVGVMNPDVTIEAKDLALLVNALRSDASIGLVTGRTIYNGEIWEPNPCAWKKGSLLRWTLYESLIGAVLTRMGKTIFSWMNVLRGYYRASKYEEGIAVVDNVQGCCFFSRIDAMKEIGGFDERTFLYYEEDILAERMKRTGLRNVVLSDAWVHHNHEDKDATLVRSATRLFHIRCSYEARKFYAEEYLGYGPFLLTILKFYWELDYHLKCFLVPFFYRR